MLGYVVHEAMGNAGVNGGGGGGVHSVVVVVGPWTGQGKLEHAR